MIEIILIKLLVILWLLSPLVWLKYNSTLKRNHTIWYEKIGPYFMLLLFEVVIVFVFYILFMFVKMVFVPNAILFFNFMFFTWS